jgi:NAD(P)-dependent dehydrogenase (short-subunit alcohol dehydrogenase family)
MRTGRTVLITGAAGGMGAHHQHRIGIDLFGGEGPSPLCSGESRHDRAFAQSCARVRTRRHHRQCGGARRDHHAVRQESAAEGGSGRRNHDRCLNREEHAGDLTGTVFFLASPDADFITGQTIIVDGGNEML